jgi:hypothetical protein
MDLLRLISLAMEAPVLVAKGWRSRLVAGGDGRLHKLSGVREKKIIDDEGSLALIPIVKTILN